MDRSPLQISFRHAARAALLLALAAACAPATAAEPLRLEAKIPLGQVRGRIDHMAFDEQALARQVAHRIAGLHHPQGVGYLPSLDLLFVANATDGSVHLFSGPGYAAAGRLGPGGGGEHGRVDAAANRVLVGYGDGGIATIDPASRRKMLD